MQEEPRQISSFDEYTSGRRSPEGWLALLQRCTSSIDDIQMRGNSYLVMLAAVALLSCGNREPIDLVLHNGKIVTADSSFTISEAIAIHGDRIAAVGTNEAMLALAASDTKRVDLGGKTVLPGLTDSHVHSPAASMYEFDHEVPDMETIADVLSYIKGRAEALKDGEWVTLSQVFITRLKEQRYPTRAELDLAAPKNPVVFRTGPDASLNTLALKLCGIDKNFKITDGQPGRIERDPKTGEPTGILQELLPLHQSKTDWQAAHVRGTGSKIEGAAGRLQLRRPHQHRGWRYERRRGGAISSA